MGDSCETMRECHSGGRGCGLWTLARRALPHSTSLCPAPSFYRSPSSSDKSDRGRLQQRAVSWRSRMCAVWLHRASPSPLHPLCLRSQCSSLCAFPSSRLSSRIVCRLPSSHRPLRFHSFQSLVSLRHFSVAHPLSRPVAFARSLVTRLLSLIRHDDVSSSDLSRCDWSRQCRRLSLRCAARAVFVSRHGDAHDAQDARRHRSARPDRTARGAARQREQAQTDY